MSEAIGLGKSSRFANLSPPPIVDCQEYFKNDTLALIGYGAQG
jgi:hypothetical protein